MSTTDIAGKQLDSLIAEKVMGWRPRTYASLNGCIGWDARSEYFAPHQTNGGCQTVDGKPWRPSTDIGDAWHVVQKMHALGWHVRINSPFEPAAPYCAGFTPHGQTGWNGRPDHEASAPTAPLAICLAAIAAMESVS